MKSSYIYKRELYQNILAKVTVRFCEKYYNIKLYSFYHQYEREVRTNGQIIAEKKTICCVSL